MQPWHVNHSPGATVQPKKVVNREPAAAEESHIVTSYLSDSSFSLWGISLGLPRRDSCRGNAVKKNKTNSHHQISHLWPLTFSVMWRSNFHQNTHSHFKQKDDSSNQRRTFFKIWVQPQNKRDELTSVTHLTQQNSILKSVSSKSSK